MIKKEKINIFGKEYYLIGIDENGIKYYLQKAHFDCEWYWGGGYVDTFTNNKNPQKSTDIRTHSHFDSMFLRRHQYGDFVKDRYFIKSPFTEKEKWQILELIQSFYTAREYSDFLYRGGSHFTNNLAKDTISNIDEYNRINDIVIPKINDELEKIMLGA